MPKISPFRILLHSNPILRRRLPLSSFPAPLPVPCRRLCFFASAVSRPRRTGGGPRRENSTLPLQTPLKDMEAGGDVSEMALDYNRKRAEGKDRRGKARKMELKTRTLNPTNTCCHVQILGTGMDTHDTSSSILLFFDKQRIIFNCGEGLQRFCTEHKIKLSKIDHMFLTRACSETTSGLAGLVLTLAGIGEEGMSVNIWGPSDLDFIIGAMRSFVPNKAVLHSHSFGSTEKCDVGTLSSNTNNEKLLDSIVLIDDEVVRISAMLIKRRHNYAFEEVTNHDIGDNLLQQTAGSSPGDISVVYACELPEIQGKFDPEKASSFGLKPGPKYRDLQSGKSVMSDHRDIMVHPNDVLGPSIPGPIILIVDCPTPEHMIELLSLHSLSCYYADSCPQSEKKKNVTCLIHLGPSAVTSCTEYQSWMRRFGDAKHIMAGHEIKNVDIPILTSSARLTTRLNYLCPRLFPAANFTTAVNVDSLSSQELAHHEATLKACNSVVSAKNLLKFHLRPYTKLGMDSTSVLPLLTYESVIDELTSEIQEIDSVRCQIRDCWREGCENNAHDGMRKRRKDSPDVPPCLENISREELEVLFLGTGSSQPSKYRNVSSIYINLFARGSMLLDCGEGTLAQLRRRFGVNGADDALRSLCCIWISHVHADHHTGLVRILAVRSQLLKGVPHDPLLVIGPKQLQKYLSAYSRLEDLDMQFLDCWHTVSENLENFLHENGADAVQSHPLQSTLFDPESRMESFNKKLFSMSNASAKLVKLKAVLDKAGLEILNSVPVWHCPNAFAVVIKSRETVNSTGETVPGWKLVYSGDTRPCPALILAAKDATLLIHEATFEDNLKEEAISRNHSTTSEAIGVGASAGAYRIILTHFSQRYPKIPVFDEADMHKTCIAFDLMSVNLADLPVLPKVVPYLKVLFRNETGVDESDIPDEAFTY